MICKYQNYRFYHQISYRHKTKHWIRIYHRYITLINFEISRNCGRLDSIFLNKGEFCIKHNIFLNISDKLNGIALILCISYKWKKPFHKIYLYRIKDYGPSYTCIIFYSIFCKVIGVIWICILKNDD